MNQYDDYAAFTETTAIYPNQVAAEYLALGLCSESSECIELLLKRHANDTHAGFYNELGAEIGDIAWYAARLAVTYDMPFGEIVLDAKRRYAPFAHTDIERIMGLLSVCCGLIAGKIKKQLRDGMNWSGEEREEARQYIRHQLIGVVLHSMYASDWLHCRSFVQYGSFDKIIQENRRKLESRKARGALGGSGSDR